MLSKRSETIGTEDTVNLVCRMRAASASPEEPTLSSP
jgi:hypothetical protein